MADQRIIFIFLRGIPVFFLLHAAQGNIAEDLVKCDTKQDSSSVCDFKEVAKSEFSRECFVTLKELSDVFTSHEANYTMYVRPDRGFLYLNMFFMNENEKQVFKTPLKVSRRHLNNRQWYQLTLKKEIQSNAQRYRWTLGDSLTTEFIPLREKTDQVILGALGPVSWTDGCDPRTSASMMKPSQNAPSEDVADQNTNELIIALSSAAAVVILILIAIIIVQNRRRTRILGETSSAEETITTIIDFPNRPPPAVPTEKDSYIISPYAQVHDEDSHFYEEVYGTGKRPLQGQSLSRTIPRVGLYPPGFQPTRTADGYPASTLICENDLPEKQSDDPDTVCLRLDSERSDQDSERDSINSTYITAIDSL